MKGDWVGPDSDPPLDSLVLQRTRESTRLPSPLESLLFQDHALYVSTDFHANCQRLTFPQSFAMKRAAWIGDDESRPRTGRCNLSLLPREDTIKKSGPADALSSTHR